MPILAEETSIYPSSLLDDFTAAPENPDSDDQRQWWTIYARSRQEKALARQLLAYEVPFYLPLVPTKQVVRGRQRCSYLPLFTGYVFAYGTETQRVMALTTNRISRILPVTAPGELLTDLRQVRDLIATNAPLTVEARLAPGARVRVKRGALQGLEGTILRRNGKTRLLVAVNYLQQGVSVEIDDFMVEPM
jgi:transcription antitermination factor NusG